MQCRHLKFGIFAPQNAERGQYLIRSCLPYCLELFYFICSFLFKKIGFDSVSGLKSLLKGVLLKQ